MTTAEQLLASLTEIDRTFVIDNDLRTIKIPADIDNLGVESDDDVLTVYFQMPGSYCGVDLSQFNIRINYLNAAEQGDYHDVDDAELQPDGTIRFSWTIGRHAASVVGDVVFNVCLKKSDASGNVIQEFNTTTATLPILKGLEVSEKVISEYNDILEQWRAKLFGVGDTEEARILAVSQEQQQVISEQSATVLSDIELKGSETLKTIPDTYTEVYNMAEEALRTKADAIVLNAEGTVISVDDSSDDHLQNLKLYGRTTQAKTTGTQLAYIPDVESFENNGITWSSNGGVVTAKGSAQIHSYTPSHIHADLKGLVGTFYLSGNGKYIKVAVQCTRDGVTNYINAPQVFTLDGTETRVELYCQITTYNVDINDTAYPVVNVGSTALPWEPYTGGKSSPNPEYPQELVSIENPRVDIYGKNLLPPRTETLEYEGLTYVTNVDGSVSITGTATSDGDSTCYIVTKDDPLILPKGTYTLSGCFGGSEKSYRILIYSTDWKYITECTDGPVSFTLDEETNVFVYIWVYRGNTVNEILYPMICEASLDSDYYEPYKTPQSLTLNRTLHGIPVTSGGNYTDENGQQWICDEVDFDRGVYIQRVRIKDLHTRTNWNTWGANVETEGQIGFYTYCEDLANRMCMSNSFPYAFYAWGGNQLGVGAYAKADGSYIIVSVLNSDLADVSSNEAAIASFVNYISQTNANVLVAIPPIETSLTSEEILAYKALRTNYPNTTVLNDQNARMEIAYNADTLIFLRDNQPKPTDEQVMAAVQEYADQNGVQVPSDDYIKNLAQQVAASALDIFKSNFKPAKIDVVTLPASAWVGEANPYSQVVSIEGVTKHSQVDLTPDVQQLAVFHEKDITFVTENEDGVITVYAIGQKPTNDYTIQVTITEVDV